MIAPQSNIYPCARLQEYLHPARGGGFGYGEKERPLSYRGVAALALYSRVHVRAIVRLHRAPHDFRQGGAVSQRDCRV